MSQAKSTGPLLQRHSLKPLHYAYRIPEIFKKTIITVWLFPTIYSLLPLFWRDDRSKIIHLVYLVCLELTGVIIPYFFITIAYLRIFKEVKQSLALRKILDYARKQVNERRMITYLKKCGNSSRIKKKKTIRIRQEFGDNHVHVSQKA